MNPPPNISYVELRVPATESEPEFLLRVVQAAIRKYRETHNNFIGPPQALFVEGQGPPPPTEGFGTETVR